MTPAEVAEHARSSVVMSSLDNWLRSAPGREVRIRFTLDEGFTISLKEDHLSRGDSLIDAASQVSTVLLLGGAL